MSHAWHDNFPDGWTSYGMSTAGTSTTDGSVGALYYFPGMAFTLLSSLDQRFCRPRSGTGHFLWNEIAFFDAGQAFLGVFDLYDHDYLMTTYTYGGFSYPTDWYDVDLVDYVTARFVAHTGVTTGPFLDAVYYAVNIQDFGPYDSTGTTTASSGSDYTPIGPADDIWNDAFACGGANITGARGPGRVLFS